MISLDAAAVRAHLPWPRMIDALDRALREPVEAPVRTRHAIEVPGAPSASLLMMPAWRRGARLGVKLVTVFPGNSAAGERSVAALYVLFDARDGRPLALLDGAELTLRRTAGASAYAARFLARPDAKHLVLLGAGHQAPGLIAAHASVRALERVSLWSRTPAHALATARAVTTEALPVTAVDDLEAAVGRADIVSCATLSTVALVRGAWLRPGTHLDLVGAFRAEMRETDDEAMRRAEVIAIDDAAALVEGGDLVHALASGAITRGHIGPSLRDLAAGRHPGRTRPDEITVFKSVGFALEDLAAAETVYEAAAATD